MRVDQQAPDAFGELVANRPLLLGRVPAGSGTDIELWVAASATSSSGRSQSAA